MSKKIVFFFIFILFINQSNAEENIMILKLKAGDVVIELFVDIATGPLLTISIFVIWFTSLINLLILSEAPAISKITELFSFSIFLAR